MKRFARIFFLLGLVLPSQAYSYIAECYSLPDPRDGVGEMVMTRSGDITYTFPDMPQILLFLSCDIYENDVVRCNQICDGGSLTVTHTSESVRLETDGIRIDSMRFDSVLNTSVSGGDWTSLYLKGDFVLYPSLPKTCQEMESRAPDITLQAGDMNVMVKSLEQNLIIGGYMMGTADYVFDAKTREALMLWQRDTGREPSGKADRGARLQLAIDSIKAFGRC